MKSCKTCRHHGIHGGPDILEHMCLDCFRLSNWDPLNRDCATCKHDGTDWLAPGTVCYKCVQDPRHCVNWEPRNGIFVQGEALDEDTPCDTTPPQNPGMTGQYTFRGGIEPIDFITSNHLDFLEGNVIKYLYRYPNKGGLEALKKAKFYVEKLIERWEEDHAEDNSNLG